MIAVLLVPAHDNPTALGAKRQTWDGQQVASIPDILSLLEV
jgi:hypothetical protein